MRLTASRRGPTLLAAACVAAFGRTVTHGFLLWDDRAFIADNPSEGKTFIREMCGALKRGTSMDEIVRRLKAYPKGPSQLEEAWAAWVQRP